MRCGPGGREILMEHMVLMIMRSIEIDFGIEERCMQSIQKPWCSRTVRDRTYGHASHASLGKFMGTHSLSAVSKSAELEKGTIYKEVTEK